MPSRQVASPNTAEAAVTVTPSDVTNQPVPFRALWVGVAGNLSITFNDGTSFTFVGVPVGFFPCGGVRVNATGTTAASLGAMY